MEVSGQNVMGGASEYKTTAVLNYLKTSRLVLALSPAAFDPAVIGGFASHPGWKRRGLQFNGNHYCLISTIRS